MYGKVCAHKETTATLSQASKQVFLQYHCRVPLDAVRLIVASSDEVLTVLFKKM